MASHISTASVLGIEAHLVDVETDISPGLGAFVIVGLPDTAIQEARERIRSAMKHSDVSFPRTRVTVNLAPADLKKTGSLFDVPIALAILMAEGHLPNEDGIKRLYAGELGLDGTLRPIHGALSIALLGKQAGFHELILPKENAPEAALVDGIIIRSASSLSDIIQHITKEKILSEEPTRKNKNPSISLTYRFDFSAIQGQAQTKRALEIAAAGGHNILMQGPPGSGKTLLARSFPSILPELGLEEMLDATRIHSIAGTLPPSGVVTERPFRAPHHSASMPSLVGGGTIPHPGEISLAHRGVLFLDELPEFSRLVLESLRQPLEDGMVTVSRAQGTLMFPARFTLLAAMNPCPCGFLTEKEQSCSCSPTQIIQYRKKLSGPLLDRIDLFLEVPKVKTNELTEQTTNEPSSAIRARVQAARNRQRDRYVDEHVITNAELSSEQIRRLITIDPDAQSLLRQAIDRHHLSARAYFRILRVSQTIADLGKAPNIALAHVAEALQYRM